MEILIVDWIENREIQMITSISHEKHQPRTYPLFCRRAGLSEFEKEKKFDYLVK
jgi:hypothetical protein